MDGNVPHAFPSYPFSHQGAVIVAGNAACLFHDLERARAVYPDAPVIAVNGAAREVNAFALYSKHPDRFESLRWAHHQRRKFGDDFSTHASTEGADYCWPGTKGGGGSAWGARKMARFMGFELVILCGCPLVPGPYSDNSNLGGFMHRDDVVADLRAGIAADVDFHDGCVSCSGWTAETLGELSADHL